MTKLSESTSVTDFDRTTTPNPIEASPGVLAVDLDAGRSSLVGVHGGSMGALAVRGADPERMPIPGDRAHLSGHPRPVVAESSQTRLTVEG